ncbi:hypothetical protein PybrP1_001102 [[Pythium] brassicae (nom. inval.)]|nr:hypothetical protein PybrP1_001102 [[Pythium] brassicae (nom. inval.)]
MNRNQHQNSGSRASVRGQRKIQSSSSSSSANAPARKKENAQPNGVIGISSVSLSSRFSGLTKEFEVKAKQQLKKQPQPLRVTLPTKKKVVDKRRKGLAPAAVPTPSGKKPSAQPKPAKAQAQVSTAAAGGGRGAGGRGRGRGRGGAAGGRGGRGSEKKEVSGDDLDVEMDAYWFEGGKGPDPKAAQLDRQMEQYWADKPKDDAFAPKEDAEKELAAL